MAPAKSCSVMADKSVTDWQWAVQVCSQFETCYESLLAGNEASFPSHLSITATTSRQLSRQSTNSISFVEGGENTTAKCEWCALPTRAVTSICHVSRAVKSSEQRKVEEQCQKKKVPKENCDGRTGRSLVPCPKKEIGRLVVKVTRAGGYPAFRATSNLLEAKNKWQGWFTLFMLHTWGKKV